MRPADNGRARRLPLDGTAMDLDESDREIVAYKRGRADERAAIDAEEALEERRWKWALATLLALVVLALGMNSLAISSAAKTQHEDADALLRATTRTKGG